MKYDSKEDTLEHAATVATFIDDVLEELRLRQ
jgi:hypothetical protein